jgi:hypothetical protein
MAVNTFATPLLVVFEQMDRYPQVLISRSARTHSCPILKEHHTECIGPS